MTAEQEYSRSDQVDDVIGTNKTDLFLMGDDDVWSLHNDVVNFVATKKKWTRRDAMCLCVFGPAGSLCFIRTKVAKKPAVCAKNS